MKFLNFLFTCTGLSPNQSVYIFTAIKSNEDVSYVSLLIMVFESILKVITITWFCPENYKIYTCVRACVRVFVGGVENVPQIAMQRFMQESAAGYTRINKY